MNPEKIAAWGKAVATVGAIGATMFLAGVRFYNRMEQIPKLQTQMDTMQGEMKFVVAYVEDRTGKKYSAPADP